MHPTPPEKAPYSFRVLFMSAPEYDPHTDVEPGLEARNLDIAEHLLSTAFRLRAAGSFEEAEPLFLQALNVYERVLGPNHPDTARHFVQVAVAYRNASRYDEAAKLLDRAIEASQIAYGPRSCELAQALTLQAWVYALKGRFDEGEQLHRQATAMFESECEPGSHAVAESLYELAEYYEFGERYAEALAVSERLLPFVEQLIRDTCEAFDYLAVHARVLRALGRVTEWQAIVDRIHALEAENGYHFSKDPEWLIVPPLKRKKK